MNKLNLGKVRGEDGKSATIAIGTVRTVPAGSNANVTNVGNSINAILDFDIPRGGQGNEGAYTAGNNVQISDGVISATDTTYAPATPSADGLMTSVDKVKLNGIATGATKNATDAELRNRATHTGTQAISTVSGLQTALDSKVDKVAGMGLSSNDFTSELKDKLTGLEGTHWRGVFVSLAALQAGVTNPVAGDYADVDAAGADVERYIWDATDSVWVVRSGGGGSSTGGGHTIQEDGVSLPQRTNLNFEGVSVVDDVINDATKIILNRNVDGGSASSVYLPYQNIDGGIG